MKELYAFAVDLAQRAGAIPLRYFRTDCPVEQKSDDSPVTVADRRTEEYLREEIEKRCPDDGILGEEFGEKIGRSGRRWILDPIDGTQSFIRGLPLFGVMIALEEQGTSRIGVIHYPALGETLSALSGLGCFCNGTPCRVSSTSALEQASLSTSYPHKIVQIWGQSMLQRIIQRCAFLSTCDCYGYLLVATGRFDVLVEPILKIWDVAPLFPIFNEAGAIISDRHRQSNLDITHILVANAALHESLLDLFQDH